MYAFLLALALLGALPAGAAPVVGWQVVNASNGAATSTPLAGAGTNSPIIGNGLDGSATQVALFAAVSGIRDGAPDVSLVNGQQIVLTGSATLHGIGSAMEQFRFGLFHEATAPFDAKGWKGYIANNSAGASGGALRAKNGAYADFESNVFASTSASGSAVNLQTVVANASFASGTYDFSMTVARFGDELLINASLFDDSGFTQTWRDASVVSPSLRTFDFNRVGFLAGANMSADKIEFHDVDVSAAPIETLTLQVVATGPDAGLARLVNKSGGPMSLEYYAIQSSLGALAPDNLAGLSAQGGAFPARWFAAGGNSQFIISEANLLDATIIETAAPIQLGRIVNGFPNDLEFRIGVAGDDRLRRAIVEYVVPGDFTGDGIVDVDDLGVWKAAFGNNAQGDANGDLLTNGVDFLIWQRNFHSTAASSIAPRSAIPEPAGLSLAAAALSLLAAPFARRNQLTLRSSNHTTFALRNIRLIR